MQPTHGVYQDMLAVTMIALSDPISQILTVHLTF